MAQTKNNALLLLQTALGDANASFRDGQWSAILELLQNNSRLLVVQRTGWGKSLVYFIATRLLRDRRKLPLRDRGSGVTLLISPLLALMRNQIAAAERIGVKAATINSSNNEECQECQKVILTATSMEENTDNSKN